MNIQWYKEKLLVKYILKTIEPMIYYFTCVLIYAHVVESLIIVQVHFDYLE